MPTRSASMTAGAHVPPAFSRLPGMPPNHHRLALRSSRSTYSHVIGSAASPSSCRTIGVAIAVKLIGRAISVERRASAWRVAAPATKPLSPTLARRRARAWIADPATSRGPPHESLQSLYRILYGVRGARNACGRKSRPLCDPPLW